MEMNALDIFVWFVYFALHVSLAALVVLSCFYIYGYKKKKDWASYIAKVIGILAIASIVFGCIVFL